MAQELVYLQKDEEILGLEKQQYERLAPEQLTDVKTLRELATVDVKKDEALKTALNDMNPHFSYIFGDKIGVFGAYLNSHHPELEFYFLRTNLPDPPDYTNIKDFTLKGHLTKKFHWNRHYKLFDIDKGKVKLRRNMPNVEAIKIIRCILLDCARVYEWGEDKDLIRVLKEEAKSLMPKLDEIVKKLESLRKEYGEIEAFAPNPNYDSEREADLKEREELWKKVHGTEPLFD